MIFTQNAHNLVYRAVGKLGNNITSSSSSSGSSGSLPPNLDQLAGLLRKPDDVEPSSWLEGQQGGMRRLDGNLLSRTAASAGHAAHLCSVHQPLDAQLVRRFMFCIADECTERMNIYRTWRGRIIFPRTVDDFLDRMDRTTALWTGTETYNKIFGTEYESKPLLSADDNCEACIMASIGFQPRLLCDLLASILARGQRYPNRKRPEPRLLALLDSWIMHCDYEVRKSILFEARTVADKLIVLNAQLQSLAKQERLDGRRASRAHRHKHKPKNPRNDRELPVPEQPLSGRYPQRSDIPVYDDWFILCDRPGARLCYLESRLRSLMMIIHQEEMNPVRPDGEIFNAASAIPSPLQSWRHMDSKRNSSETQILYTHTAAPDMSPFPAFFNHEYEVSDHVSNHSSDQEPAYTSEVDSDSEDGEEPYMPPRQGWASSPDSNAQTSADKEPTSTKARLDSVVRGLGFLTTNTPARQSIAGTVVGGPGPWSAGVAATEVSSQYSPHPGFRRSQYGTDSSAESPLLGNQRDLGLLSRSNNKSGVSESSKYVNQDALGCLEGTSPVQIKPPGNFF